MTGAVRRRRGAIALGMLIVVSVAGCWGPSDEDAFCAQLKVVQDTGPLFPSRTDGEPVPNHDAYEALLALGERAPGEISDDVATLIAEASALVAEAETRRSNSQVEPKPDRLSRSVVEEAQTAVVQFAAVTCDIDLTRLSEPGVTVSPTSPMTD